jgi:urate oxidase
VIELGANRYGKQSVRLVRVVRGPVHRVRDLTVDVSLEGAFETAYTAGDNSSVVATDTMKNTVYALAPEHLTGAIETFGIAIARHFLAADPVARATVAIREHKWEPLPGAGGPAPDAFSRSGAMTRVATVSAGAAGIAVESGIQDLVVMKTAKSAFSGFPRDRYTTLREVRDRIMATRITATWRHHAPRDDWDASHDVLVRTLLGVFADHVSESVQQSIWVMGQAMLEADAGIDEVSMSLPNLHHWLVDLAPFGGSNAGEIFVATAEPFGLIEATVRRSTAS